MSRELPESYQKGALEHSKAAICKRLTDRLSSENVQNQQEQTTTAENLALAQFLSYQYFKTTVGWPKMRRADTKQVIGRAENGTRSLPAPRWNRPAVRVP